MLSLAWRNIWRNRRRSALTIASIGTGLAAVMFGQSIMKTVQSQMIEKATGIMAGHVQVQAVDVTDRKFPDQLIRVPASIEPALDADARVLAASPRIVYTGLAYSAAGSRGVVICGVRPETEEKLSLIPTYLKQGKYFGTGERGIVLGDTTAKELDARIGERLVLMAQSKSGDMNSELFRVAGLYHTGSEQYDKQIVYIPITMAQKLRGVGTDQVSYEVARLRDFRDAEALKAKLAGLLGKGLGAYTYKEMGLEVLGIQKFEDAIMTIVMTIVFAIVGLGVLNTVSMSLFERIREFGVLRAIGAKPRDIARLLFAESAMLGAVGIAAGLAVGLGMIGLFGKLGMPLPVGQALSYFLPFDPVVYLRPFWALHARSLCLLLLVSPLATIGPAARAARMKVAQALRHL